MAKIDSFNEHINLKEVELQIIESLLKRGKVVIPDFGHLEIKSFGDKRTILLKSPEGNDSFYQLMSSISEKDKKDTNTLYKAISAPLKEGKTVNLPQVGVFRPVIRENGKIHLSFIPAISLKKLLNRDEEEEIEEIVNINEIETIPKISKSLFELQKSEKDKEKDKNKFGSGETVRGYKWEEPVTPQKSKFDSFPQEKRAPAIDIVKTDDQAEIKRSRNFTGTLLLVVALIVLVVTVAINIVYQSGKKEDDKGEIIGPVESQFTLTSLAEQYYGHPAFWIYIYYANMDKLNSPINIEETVSLVIPDLKTEYNVDITDSTEIQRAKMSADNVLKFEKK